MSKELFGIDVSKPALESELEMEMDTPDYKKRKSKKVNPSKDLSDDYNVVDEYENSEVQHVRTESVIQNNYVRNDVSIDDTSSDRDDVEKE